MALRTARTGAKKAGRLVVIEARPPDEQPKGVPDPRPQPKAMPRPPYAKGSPEAREAASRGGKARAGRTAAADTLGLGKGNKYRNRAQAFHLAQVNYLRKHVGGGRLAPDIRALVKLGALALAAAERAYDKGDDVNGRAAALEARQTFATAREYAAKEAKDRGEQPEQTQQTHEALKAFGVKEPPA